MFLWKCRREERFLREIAQRLLDKCRQPVMGWFLLIMCKGHALTRPTNLISRSHPTLSFWLRREVTNCLRESWYLIIWLKISVQSSAMNFQTVILFKLILGSHCLELCFWTVGFKNHPDSVILQKCQSLSNQSFNYNSVHMLSFNLTRNLFPNNYCTKSKRM